MITIDWRWLHLEASCVVAGNFYVNSEWQATPYTCKKTARLVKDDLCVDFVLCLML